MPHPHPAKAIISRRPLDAPDPSAPRINCDNLRPAGAASCHRQARAQTAGNGGIMHLLKALLTAQLLSMSLVPFALGATITGTVTGPDGKPFMGAFVVAENPQNKMTVSVLSSAQGRYHISNLPAATYTVKITAIGYTGIPRNDVRLTEDQKV